MEVVKGTLPQSGKTLEWIADYMRIVPKSISPSQIKDLYL